MCIISQDIKAQDCALIITGLETKINSIDEGDIEYPNKISEEVKNMTFCGKRLELEKSLLKSSKLLANSIVEKVENAKENIDQSALENILKDHVDSTCNDTFLSSNKDLALPEWVIVAKNQIMKILKSHPNEWGKEMTESTGRAA